MKLKIFHLFANEYNHGDLGSAEEIKRLLIENVKAEIEFENHLIAAADLSKETINRINSVFNLVVIGGGGLYWPESKGLLLKLSKKSIKRIKKPIITYAIGINYEYYHEKKHQRLLKNIKFLNKYLMLNSVRDEMTINELVKVGVKSDLVPCPSSFLPSTNPFDLESKKEKVGLVLIPLMRLKKEIRKPYLRIIAEFAEIMDDRYQFYLIAHGKIVEDSYYQILKYKPFKMIYPSNPTQLMSAYSQMDFLIGSRGHMGIFALGSEKPFINISYNIKCRAFCEMINYPNQFTVQIENLNCKNLVDKFNNLVLDRNKIIELLKKRKSIHYQMNLDYLSKVNKLLTNYGYLSENKNR